VKQSNPINHSLPSLQIAIFASLLSSQPYTSNSLFAIWLSGIVLARPLYIMGSGAAKHRALRRQAKQSAPPTSQSATWGSSRTTSFEPASSAQLLEGWQSFSTQERSFTLYQEAHNTHRSYWSESNPLRNNAIQFVSGGNLRHDNPEGDTKKEGLGTEHVSPFYEGRQEAPSKERNEIKGQSNLQHEDEGWTLRKEETDIGITKQVERIDLSAVNTNSSFNRRRSTSASSASSSEVILFAGRGKPLRERKQSSTPPTPHNDTLNALKPSTFDKSSPATPPRNIPPSLLKPDAKEFVPVQNRDSTPRGPFGSQIAVALGGWKKEPIDAPNRPDRRNSKRRQRWGRRNFSDSDGDEEEEGLRDYMENVKANEGSAGGDASFEENEHHRGYRGSGLENAKVRVANSTVETNPHGSDRDNDWTSDDLRDFDALDTSEEELAEIGGVFSCRKRPSGLQYLVTPVGQSTDFAKWILEENLASTRAKELISAFEESHPGGPADSKDEEAQADEDQWNDSSSGESDEEDIKDLAREQESEHEENERFLYHTSRMTDSQIAQALAKQEELGMGGDDIILFGGAFDQGEDFVPFSTRNHISNRTRSKQNRRSKATFPSAEAFADVLDEDPYNGFDVMDFDRPSLKAKKRGRKSANGLPFELEDDELADQLAQSWANDRAKKAHRKAEREELRQAGLLGPRFRKGRANLQTKHQHNGIDIDQIKAEVRAFLLDHDREALRLAPMSSPQRAQVHLLAKALHLKSQSQGKGDPRFPILTKTDFSGRYDEDSIGQIDALLAKRKFSAYWGKKDKAAPPRSGGKVKRGGGGTAGGATYMDGDVVGASAPELGSENRGRAILEKMGWSSGMGIGKAGSQGRVEVIQHVVKNSKAGLG
jgi:R3H domain/G-patch domain